jgi:iron complex outermembrane recepter protein
MRTASYAMLTWAVSVTLNAVASDDDHRAMEHVLVTLPIHQAATETSLPITVLSGDELAREAAATLGETLDRLPGVHNASFGPGVGQPVIRGLSGPRVTTLQNGTRSADASAISADHVVAVESLLADSIEVLRGPATLLYGGGAIGGVVNVIDNRIPTTLPEDTTWGVDYRYTGASSGSNGTFRLDTAWGPLAVHADALFRDTESLEVPEGAGTDGADTLPNTDTEALAGTLGLAYHFDGGFFGVSVNHQENEYGLPEGSHGHHDDEHGEEHDDDHDEEHEEEGHDDHDEDHDDHDEEHGEGEEEEEETIRLDMEQTRYDVRLQLDNPLDLIQRVAAVVSITEYEHTEFEGVEVGTIYASDAVEGRLEVVHSPLGNFHGVFGLQISETEFSAVGEEAFVMPTDISRFGIFLVEDWHAGALQLEGGLRLDKDELSPEASGAPDRDYTSFSASLGALYEFTESWHASATLSHSERAPSVEELYSNYGNTGPSTWVTHAATAAIELGDTHLDGEESLNVDVGVSLHGELASLRLGAYYNDFDSYINLASTGLEVGETPVRRYEQDSAEFMGIELDADWTVLQADWGELVLEGEVDLVRGELGDGSDVPRLPPMMGAVGLVLEQPGARYFTRLTAADRQDRPGANEEMTSGWARWDLGGEWRITTSDAEITLSAAVRNIQDEEIRLSTSVLREFAPEPGRSFDLGVRVQF